MPTSIKPRIKKNAQEQLDARKPFPGDNEIKIPVEGTITLVNQQPQGLSWLWNGVTSGLQRVGLVNRPIPHTTAYIIHRHPGSTWHEQPIIVARDASDEAIEDLRTILHDSFFALYERGESAERARQIINQITAYLIMMIQLIQQSVTDQNLAPYFHIATGAIELVADFLTTIILPLTQNKAAGLQDIAENSISQLNSLKGLNDWKTKTVGVVPDRVPVPTQFHRGSIWHLEANKVRVDNENDLRQDLVSARANLKARAASADKAKLILTGIKGLIIGGISLTRYVKNDPTTNIQLNLTVAAVEATFTLITTLIAPQTENKAIKYAEIAGESLDLLNQNKIVMKGSYI